MKANISLKNELIEKKVNELPDNLKREVLDFIEFLIDRNRNKKDYIKEEKFNFDWEGGLSDYKNKHTSIELQHISMKWR